MTVKFELSSTVLQKVVASASHLATVIKVNNIIWKAIIDDVKLTSICMGILLFPRLIDEGT